MNMKSNMNGHSNSSKAEGKVIKAKSDAASALEELFEAQLKDISLSEQALTQAIPKMIANASDADLVHALEDHLTVTEEQVKRVEQVFEAIGKKAEAKECAAMKGLIEEAKELMEETEEGVTYDWTKK